MVASQQADMYVFNRSTIYSTPTPNKSLISCVSENRPERGGVLHAAYRLLFCAVPKMQLRGEQRTFGWARNFSLKMRFSSGIHGRSFFSSCMCCTGSSMSALRFSNLRIAFSYGHCIWSGICTDVIADVISCHRAIVSILVPTSLMVAGIVVCQEWSMYQGVRVTPSWSAHRGLHPNNLKWEPSKEHWGLLAGPRCAQAAYDM